VPTTLRRLIAVSAASATVMLAHATPALAAMSSVDPKRDPGDEPGPGLTVLETFLYFVAAPIAISAIVTLLVMAPSWTRRGRLGTDVDWSGEPLRVSGAAIESDASATSSQAITAAETSTMTDAGGKDLGGSSARW
jgi:hypothetical protein